MTTQVARFHFKVCPECLRAFDMSNDIDAQEWAYGHDCEEQ